MTFKKSVSSLLALLVLVVLSTSSSAFQLSTPRLFPALVDLLSLSASPDRFLPFSDYSTRFEPSLNKAGMDFFNTHPDMVKRIRKDLGSRDVRWRLSEVSHRVMYAPETRSDLADMFTRYCREVIKDMLARIGLENPYASIGPMGETIPELTASEGIHALIVQDLATDYNAQYLFSGNGSRRIAIDLNGRMAINEIGSYSSYLEYSEEINGWMFTRVKRHSGQTGNP